MDEVLVRLPPPLYQRLVERVEVDKLDLAEAIVEAVKHWLRKEEQPSVEERFQRALESTGLLVPPEEKRYAVKRPVDRDALMRKLAQIRLDPPLSEDIIASRR